MVFVLLFFSSINRLYAVDVFIAPFLYIDEKGDVVNQQSGIHHDLYRELNKIETGTNLQFLSVRNLRMNPPQSMLDAAMVCRNEKIDFLLYGYIAKRDYTYNAEIRLYSYEGKSIIKTFYGIEDHSEIMRMFEDLAIKIVEYMINEYNLAIVLGEPEYFEFWMPFNIGYWTMIGQEWASVTLGVAFASIGIEFIPSDRLFVMSGKPAYLSTGINVGYRYGMGNKEVAYEAVSHIITITGTGRFHVKLNSRHSVNAGIGASYSFEILRVSEHYLDPKGRIYNTFGIEAELGYIFRITPRWSLSFENVFECRFFEPLMFTYSPRIGVKYLMYHIEVKKKW
jgi:hypothetical protein